MVNKAIYTEKNCNPAQELLRHLSEAVAQLDLNTKAVVPINKAGRLEGYGMNNTNKNMACDRIISIVKEIKKIKGW